MVKRTGTTNVQLQGLIQLLKKQASEQKAKIWKRVAVDLEKPTRQKRVVNISRINRCAKDGETIIVPGKVLGSGILDHKVDVVAWDFSKGAIEKIRQAKGSCISIPDMLSKNPKGQKMRIIG